MAQRRSSGLLQEAQVEAGAPQVKAEKRTQPRGRWMKDLYWMSKALGVVARSFRIPCSGHIERRPGRMPTHVDLSLQIMGKQELKDSRSPGLGSLGFRLSITR